ncbi:uncharacterized protein LOC108222238 isoform X2 [Daucus carota subsp. sativus]|uniref:uncharacterized protein LOC108222238 isoform X2 n=1 Tax=Daucus carota subsp. sativus TaxID=79200 RepID=UPI0030837E85
MFDTRNMKMSQLLNLYLFLYNSLQACGWAISLIRVLSSFISTTSVTSAYASSGELICLLQTVALLETIHGAIGIVPNGALFPLLQWFGRTHCVVAVAHGVKEVVRYPNYALNCFGTSPYILTYLRYTLFIVLYPTGFLSELWLMYKALPFIKKKKLYEGLFAGLPFGYSGFVLAVICLYPLIFPKMYLHMFKQRRSKLGKYHIKKAS